jgi:hypothetical protein
MQAVQQQQGICLAILGRPVQQQQVVVVVVTGVMIRPAAVRMRSGGVAAGGAMREAGAGSVTSTRRLLR